MVHHPAFRVGKNPFCIFNQRRHFAVNLGLMAQAGARLDQHRSM